MTPTRLEASLYLFLLLCTVATVAIGIHMARPWGDNYAYQDASGYGVLALMLLWAVSPYPGLALGLRLLRGSRVAARVFAGGALILAIPGLVAYVDAAFVHLDAQGGLVFVFAPLLQWAGLAALGMAGALLRLWKPDPRGGERARVHP